MQDHMYTWTFDSESRLIRFYLWAWEGKASDLNFCKLFWGMLFSPLAILFHVLRFIFTPIFTPIYRAIQAMIPPSQEETMAQRSARYARERREEADKERLRRLKAKAKSERGPSGLSRTLDRITGSIDSAVNFFQEHTTVSKVFVVLGTALVYVVGAAACLAVLGGIVYVIATWTVTFLTVLGIILGAILLVGLLVLLGIYLDDSGKGKRFGERVSGGGTQVQVAC